MLLLKLFWEFFKTGLFALGGGMATVPFLFRMGENTGWFDATALTDMIAVSESTPGPIGVNMATYVGYKVSGITGALVATLGLVLPSVIIIVLIAAFLDSYMEKPLVKSMFAILRPAATGMLCFAFLKLAQIAVADVKTVVCFILFTVCVFTLKKVHPVVWILAGALVGILFL